MVGDYRRALHHAVFVKTEKFIIGGAKIMSFEGLLAKSLELIKAVEALSALAAKLRLGQTNQIADPRLAARLDRVVNLIQPGLLEDVDHAQQGTVLAEIETSIRQALKFLQNPASPPGWCHDDPEVLNNQGKASRVIVSLIQKIAERRTDLAMVLRRGGRFLDIGTGTGWIAIRAAEVWPTLDVTGIDIWQPSLALARQNVETRGQDDRVSIVEKDLRDLDYINHYNLVWWPSVFMPEDIVRAGVLPVTRAIAPGGLLVFAFEALPVEPLARSLAELRVARMGGYPWHNEEAEALLCDAGLTAVEPILFQELDLVLMVAQKPPFQVK